MRKNMNNHFGYARLFNNARFKLPLMLDPDDGVSGGSSDAGADISGLQDDQQEDDHESIEALKAELAKSKADAERYKNSINKLTKEKKELSDKARNLMTTDQLEKEAQEAREKRFAEMEKELRVSKYSKRLVGVGMTEEDADKFASTMPEMEDADAFFNTLGAFVKSREKTAADNAIQDLLKSRPDINAGHGDLDKDDPAMELAKASLKHMDSRGVNENILKNYI